jgi:hypothetical protein
MGRGAFMGSRVIVFGLIFAGLASWNGAGAADAKRDHSYQKLKQAILSGKNISMTVDLAACHIHGTDKPGPSVRGSLHFEGFMIEADQSIAFATTHFTVKSDNTPMDEVLSFRIQPSGAIIARTRFLNASTYDVLHDSEFDCSIGNGTKFYW